MKVELEIENDLLWYNDNEEQTILVYRVRFTKFCPYKNNDNYLCHREITDELSSDSISKLYEEMGQLVVDYMIYAEKENKRDSWEYPLDEFTIEFSNIYVEVALYDKEKMKNSESYKNIGAAKEKARAQEAAEKAKEEKRRREWEAAERERKDREDYERLSRKFGKSV